MTITLVPSLRPLPALPDRPADADPLGVLGVPGQINLDHAASAPCARAAADAVAELLPWYASVHRGAGALSRRCTLAYERARQTVGDFLGARADDHVIFTRNTTDAVNLLARALPAGTTVVTFAGEHHANLLPWPRGSVRLPVPESPAAAVRALDAALGELRRVDAGNEPAPRSAAPATNPARPGPPVLVAVTGASNVTGERWPVAELARVAHRHSARILVDAAQLAPHAPVDLAALDVDYLALSGHKLYAPFGAGVLVGRSDWLDAAPPYLAGGGATGHVGAATHDVRWTTGPARHEAGTPNLLGAVALAAVCAALTEADRDALHAREQRLLARLREGLAALPHVVELRTFAPEAPRVGIVSFVVAGRDSAEVAAHLATAHQIGVRDGLFCAHPLARRLLAEAAARSGRRDLPPTALRASIGLGSTAEEVDRLVAALAAVG
ncbi:aminotransferase class V-fold PLP-dependent enzyme [Micromonospora sp. 4G57]|uniref:Aminotransferase class V-fold PLP-dependent enzyme n=1 Tax=Micromonospora sicca TaxID=2202420 RepID=A0ABU5JMF1_9ACTN|nr:MULTISPECIES: aminotransferase class V-fold PLP-dependent enzyme [unclassified Micromonospora]MDZ5441360.1 aminotransferase class V-fold PLP-dependent enzyme [Micromonospora sp. 4G57]MDZ5493793.1 aminotransferase class V-fold PLP-dependent enzyme [Micromonospora sp. 4G53]